MPVLFPRRAVSSLLLSLSVLSLCSAARAQDEMDDVDEVAAELAADQAEAAGESRDDDQDARAADDDDDGDAAEDEDASEDGGGDRFERNTGDAYWVAALLLGAAGTDERGPADVERNFTFGVLGRYMLPVHPYVSIGGQAALRSWQSEVGMGRDSDRNLILELAFVPAVTYPATREIEVHAVLPIGLGLNFAGDFAGDPSIGTGLAIGFLVGARFFLDPGFGLLAELGYMSHSFNHDIDEPTPVEVDIHTDEASLNVGLVF